MRLRRALHVMGAGALTGALLLGTAPTAGADDIRDRQWPLKGFAADDVWEHSKGKGTTVAVIDSGVDASHPDLKGQVLKGKDLTREGGSAQKDSDGHGTGMASIIAAHGHGSGNASGAMGLAPESKILPVRYKHGELELGTSLSKAIEYSVKQGADVISISQGDESPSKADEQAVRYALDHNVIVVAATGNDGGTQDKYPAAYPGVVGVAGIDESLGMWKDSNKNSNTLLAAPATNIVGADPDAASGYHLANGTSDATAYVSAAAALVRSKYPDLSAGQVVNRLTKSAMLPKSETDKNPKLPTDEYGYGIIRPYAALTRDIPKGSKIGPLKTPASQSEESKRGGAWANSASDEDSGSRVNMFGVLLVVLVGAAVVGGVVVLVVRARKRKGGSGGPGGPGTPGGMAGGGHVPPQQYAQQPTAPSGQFGPPPNQPPQ